MKKYFLSMLVIAIFAIGFTASDDADSSSSKKSNETTKAQEPQKNPFENFAGTYTLYDDWRTGDAFIVADDGRFFAQYGGGSPTKCGTVNVISDNVFKVTLSKDMHVFDTYKYRNGDVVDKSRTTLHGLRAVVFDISENKLYISENDYDNRDYSSPEYYKFKFKKRSKVEL